MHEIEPELNMWMAALKLFLDDARDCITKGDDKQGYRAAALRDIRQCGPMTCHLARMCCVTPDDVLDAWRRMAPLREAA